MGAGRVTVAALAAELGISAETVRIEAMRAGVTGYRGPYTAAQAEAIRAVRRDRLARVTQQALAAQLGVSPLTIARHAGRLRFGGGAGYTPEQAEAIRRSLAALRRPPTH